jgi:hypothetical protein
MRFDRPILLTASAFLLLACGQGEVSNEHNARQAYLGLDTAIDRAMQLGMAGYNAATSANIPDQTADGDASGTMVVGGKVDAGVSANKEMELDVALDDYSDGALEDEDGRALHIVYQTDEDDLPVLSLSLRDMPDGTFTGTFRGRFLMEGDLEGEVSLDLDVSGDLEEVPDGDGAIRRKRGTISVTGTATSRYGTYDVDVSL